MLCSKHEPTDITLLETGKLKVLRVKLTEAGLSFMLTQHGLITAPVRIYFHLCLYSTTVVKVETKTLSLMNDDDHLSFLSYLGMVTSLPFMCLCHCVFQSVAGNDVPNFRNG